MLSLTDTIWRDLEVGYRVPYDASKALARMENGESVWEELWNELHHQGDVGIASYAAIPRIVRISEAQRRSDGTSTRLLQQLKLNVIARTTHRCRTGSLPPTKVLGNAW